MTVFAANAIIYAFLFVLGACTGSFGNVLIYRLPREVQFLRGSSFCFSCGKSLKPRDLVPIFSWLLLGGKCRLCGARIPTRYPVVELASGGLAVLAAVTYGFTLYAFVCFLVFFILLLISFIDCEHMIIPNKLVLALLVLTLAQLALIWADYGSVGIISHVIGLFSLSIPMLLLTLLIPNAFGGGDIKLIAVCGLLLGVKLTLLAGFIAVMLGGIYGIYKKYIRRDKDIFIAFGQYICAGVFISMLKGNQIIAWYLSAFMR